MGVYSADEVRTWIKYAATAMVAFIAGTLVYVVPLLMDPNEPAISWRMALGFGISALTGTGISTRLARPGKESVSRQVNALANIGLHPSEMVVVPTQEATVTRADAVDANPKMLDAKLPPAA